MHLMELRLLTMITKWKIKTLQTYKTLPFHGQHVAASETAIKPLSQSADTRTPSLNGNTFFDNGYKQIHNSPGQAQGNCLVPSLFIAFSSPNTIPFRSCDQNNGFLLWNLLPILLLLMLPKKFLLHLLLLNSSTRCSGNRMQIDLKKKEVGLISHATVYSFSSYHRWAENIRFTKRG